jgi:hypothetical protein
MGGREGEGPMARKPRAGRAWAPEMAMKGQARLGTPSTCGAVQCSAAQAPALGQAHRPRAGRRRRVWPRQGSGRTAGPPGSLAVGSAALLQCTAVCVITGKLILLHYPTLYISFPCDHLNMVR